MTPTSTPPPPPPGAPTDDRSTDGPDAVPPPPGRPVRRSGDRVVAGVAAGLGRHWGIDPVLVRVLFVVTTFAAGLGALAYAVLWIVLPRVEGPAPVDATPAPRGAGFWVGVAAVTIGGIIALGNLPAPRLLVPLALIAIGAALWQRPGSPAQRSEAQPGPGSPGSAGVVPGGTPGSTTEPVSTAGATAETTVDTTAPVQRSAEPDARVAAAGGDGAGSSPGQQELRWWVPPPPRPRPSWLGPIVVAVALLATGVVAALGAADVLAVRASDLVAVALLVLAGGLVVGTFWGRAKWLSLPAAALAGLLVALQLLGSYGVELVPTIGERRVTATSLDGTLEARHGIGELVVDLGDAEIGPGATVDLDLGIGHGVVVVPDDVTVEVVGEVGIGAVNAWVASGTDPETSAPLVSGWTLADGTDLAFDDVVASAAPDAPVLRLDVAAGIAGIDLYRGRDVRDARSAPVGVPFDEGWNDAEVEERLGRFVLEELCARTVPDAEGMAECWGDVVGDRALVTEVAATDDFFADFCLDPGLVADDPDLVTDCLDLLEDRRADLATEEDE